jgi:hypothetical protein
MNGRKRFTVAGCVKSVKRGMTAAALVIIMVGASAVGAQAASSVWTAVSSPNATLSGGHRGRNQPQRLGSQCHPGGEMERGKLAAAGDAEPARQHRSLGRAEPSRGVLPDSRLLRGRRGIPVRAHPGKHGRDMERAAVDVATVPGS